MRSFVITSILVFAIGVTFSLYLILSKEDIALMLLKAGRVAYPEKYYKGQYAAGKKGVSIVGPLQQIEIEKGNVSEAIKILKNYVDHHPHDIDALELLTHLYLMDQRRAEYLNSLAKLAKETKNPEELKKLSNWYLYLEETNKAKETLEELIDKGIATEKDYYFLASYLTDKGDLENALKYLEMRQKKFPKVDDVEAVNLQLYIYNALGKKNNRNYGNQMVETIANYLTLQPKIKEVIQIINALEYLGQEDEIASLKEAFLPYAQHSPTLQALLWRIMKNYEGPRELIKEIQDYMATKPLTPEMVDEYIGLLVAQQDWKDLDDFALQAKLEEFPQGTLLVIAEGIIRQHDPELAEELLSRFDAKFLEENPLVRVAFDIATGKPDKANLLQIASSSNFTIDEKLAMLRLVAHAKLTDLTLAMSKEIGPPTLFSQSQFMQLASIFSLINKDKEGYEYFIGIKKEVVPEVVNPAFYYLKLKVGDTEGVMEWVKEHGDLNPDLLVEIWDAAFLAKDYQIAYVIAENLHNHLVGLKYQAIYAESLLDIGKVEEGYQIFNELIKKYQSPLVEDGYIKSLVLTSKSHPERKALVEAILQKYLANPIQSKLRLQSIGFLFLEQLNDVAIAKEVFFAIAEKEPFKSPPVQALLFIMGPRPTLKEVAWIKQRTYEADFADLHFWVEQLNYIGQHETVIEIVNCIPIYKRNFALHVALFRAYWDTKQIHLAADALTAGIHFAQEPEEYFKYAKIADDANLYDEEREARMIIVAMHPDQAEYWHNLAKVAYEQHDYNGAAEFVFVFFDTLCRPICPRDYLDYFYLAEVYYQKEMKRSALERYWKAYQLFQEIPAHELTIQDQTTYAQILFRLGCIDLAYSWMSSAFEASHNDPDVRASWAQMMMDNGNLNWAEEFLFWYD